MEECEPPRHLRSFFFDIFFGGRETSGAKEVHELFENLEILSGCPTGRASLGSALLHVNADWVDAYQEDRMTLPDTRSKPHPAWWLRNVKLGIPAEVEECEIRAVYRDVLLIMIPVAARHARDRQHRLPYLEIWKPFTKPHGIVFGETVSFGSAAYLSCSRSTQSRSAPCLIVSRLR
jgi:hypothetical protein